MLRVINTAALSLAIALAFGGSAVADHKYRGGPVEAQDHGYEHGYSNGFHQGATDRERHNKPKPEVRDSDAGYEKQMGDKDHYKEGFKSGFIAGYDDGFNNRPGRFSEIYGTNSADRARGTADRSDDIYSGWSASHVASDLGYRDGLVAGQSDYQRHLDPRPEAQRDFRDGDDGYRPTYGDRLVYQQQYRDAFVQGYRDSYAGRR